MHNLACAGNYLCLPNCLWPCYFLLTSTHAHWMDTFQFCLCWVTDLSQSLNTYHLFTQEGVFSPIPSLPTEIMFIFQWLLTWPFLMRPSAELCFHWAVSYWFPNTAYLLFTVPSTTVIAVIYTVVIFSRLYVLWK